MITTNTSRKIALAAITGGAYAALTMLLAPISYGPIQFRISEALCVLPFFAPVTAWGLFVGCFLSNLISSAGLPDIVFGSSATLLAALCTAAVGTYYRRQEGASMMKFAAVACFMPVLFNGPIVGAILAYTVSDGAEFRQLFLLFCGEVALGEAVVMYGLGLPLARALPELRLFEKIRGGVD